MRTLNPPRMVLRAGGDPETPTVRLTLRANPDSNAVTVVATNQNGVTQDVVTFYGNGTVYRRKLGLEAAHELGFQLDPVGRVLPAFDLKD